MLISGTGRQLSRERFRGAVFRVANGRTQNVEARMEAKTDSLDRRSWVFCSGVSWRLVLAGA